MRVRQVRRTGTERDTNPGTGTRASDARSSLLGRRAFLAGMGAVAVVGACSGGDDAAGDNSSESTLDDLLLIQPGFADGLRAASTLAAGTTVRAPFFLFDGAGGPAVLGLPDRLVGDLTAPDGSVREVDLPRHDSGIPVPYFLLTHPDAQAGLHTLRATIGGETQETQFVVADSDDVGLVQVGDRLRTVDTPTFDDPRGYAPICTRFEPCPFHASNLAEVIDNGRPTALLIATPGYCQTTVCGPSVELLIELGISSGMDIVHAEVYLEPGGVNDTGTYGEVGPVATTYGLTFEPSFVVADEAGIVTARLDFSFDKVEMREALVAVGA
jgi:hypothetical protein